MFALPVPRALSQLPVFSVASVLDGRGLNTASVRRAATLLLGGAAIAVLLAGGLAFIIGRRIAAPISALAGAAASLARGETVDLDASAVREVKDLHDALVTAGGAVRQVAAERHGREAAEEAERRASFLARATTALASSRSVIGTRRRKRCSRN